MSVSVSFFWRLRVVLALLLLPKRLDNPFSRGHLGLLVCLSVGSTVKTLLNCDRFLCHCSCPTICNWIGYDVKRLTLVQLPSKYKLNRSKHKKVIIFLKSVPRTTTTTSTALTYSPRRNGIPSRTKI